MKNEIKMKKYIIISLLCTIPIIVLKAQYNLTVQTTFPVLEIKDKHLEEQLDSILFIAYPCTSYGDKFNEYIYLTTVEEEAPEFYIINIIFSKPSIIEENVNTGIYKLEDKGTFIIREKSKTPLFRANINFATHHHLCKIPMVINRRIIIVGLCSVDIDRIIKGY